MDEVDGMSAGDRGGVADLIASIKISKIPIVCICNDRFSQKLKSLVNYCLLLNFRKPTKQQVISCHIGINNDFCKVLLVFLLLSITLLLPLLLTLTTDMLFSLLSCLQYLGRDVISVLLLILSHTNRLFNLVFLNIRKHGYLM
jgi:hypothetical protein